MVREWNRSTARSGWDAFPGAAVARYMELHRCEDLGDGVLACVVTVSEPAKRRRLGRGAASQRTVIAVTPRYLVWATADDAVAAARLTEIEAREYRPTLIEDTGLEIVGFRLGASERESWFLPLDEGADGREFRARLQQATADATP
jgi:hypothetical protein